MDEEVGGGRAAARPRAKKRTGATRRTDLAAVLRRAIVHIVLETRNITSHQCAKRILEGRFAATTTGTDKARIQEAMKRNDHDWSHMVVNMCKGICSR